nr:unnamed protein product [Callosobruchus chinensis]
MAVVNAWRLYQLSSEEPMGLLQFQRDIVLHYLVGKDKSQFRNRPPGYVPATVRKVNNGHYPEKMQVSNIVCTENISPSEHVVSIGVTLHRSTFIKSIDKLSQI